MMSLMKFADLGARCSRQGVAGIRDSVQFGLVRYIGSFHGPLAGTSGSRRERGRQERPAISLDGRGGIDQ